MTLNEMDIKPTEDNFIIILLLSTLIIAPNFAIGASVFGNKIMQNTGKEIILFGRIEAIIIAFVTASLLLLASVVKGVPTSLVQLNVGAILGIGVAKLGAKNIFRKTEVNKFFIIWLIAPIISFGISFLLTWLVDTHF
jgi:phosphate/sulfate permease